MNFMGKNLDDNTVKKMMEIINSKEGQKLKEELSKLDRKDLLDKINSMKISQNDLKDISEKINSSQADEILRKIKSNKNFFSK